MVTIRRLIAFAFALFPTVAFAQGPGPGPTPTPSPWTYAAPAIYAPAGSCITLPQTVTGGCPVGGNAFNVSGGYYINGAQIQSITSTSLPLQFSSGTLSLNINSTLIVSGSNLGINLGSPNTWTVSQTISATEGFWDIRSASGGNAAFVDVAPNGVGAQRTYFGAEGTAAGQLLAGDGPLDSVIANTTVTGRIVFGTNAAPVMWLYPSGCLFIGTSPGDCGANNLQVPTLTSQVMVGGSSPGVPITIQSTTSGSPSGDKITLEASQVIITLAPGSGAGALVMATSGSGAIYGGPSTGSQLNLTSTTSGSPSGDQVNLEASNVYVLPKNGSGAGSLNLGSGSGNPTITGNSQAGPTFTIQSTSNGTPSGDSLVLKASAITLRAFSGVTTVNCGVGNVSSCQLVMAASVSGTGTLQFVGSAGSSVITFPNVTDTVAVLASNQSFTAVETFTGQNVYNMANTIASATAATLDDLKVAAATTTITGNTGSPITALSKFHILQPTFTDSSAVTVTTAATLTIDNAPAQAGSVTITNAYALNVVAGSTLLGGKVFMSGLTAGSGTKAMCINATANEVQTDTSATICGISALRYKNLISEITPDQGLGILTLRGETYRYKPDVMQDAKVHVSLIADDMSALNHDCAEYSAKGVENYMDRCFEAYQVAYDKKLWEIIGKLTNRLPANDGLRTEVQTLRR